MPNGKMRNHSSCNHQLNYLPEEILLTMIQIQLVCMMTVGFIPPQANSERETPWLELAENKMPNGKMRSHSSCSHQLSYLQDLTSEKIPSTMIQIQLPCTMTDGSTPPQVNSERETP